MHNAIKDIKKTIKMLPVALFFAYSDLKARYRRSLLGPLWLVIGTTVGVAGLGLLWSILLKQDRHLFIPSLTVGLVTWQLISGTVIESSRTFVTNASLIRNVSIPFGFYPTQLVMRQLVNFAHNAMVIFVVLIIYPPNISIAQWLIIPGLLLLIGNLLWIAFLFGMMGARFRDLEPLISTFMPLMFFLSPVIYRPDQLGFKSALVWANPFSYLIAIIRDPIQGIVPEIFVYQGATLMLLVGWVFTFVLLQKKYQRIAFWV